MSGHVLRCPHCNTMIELYANGELKGHKPPAIERVTRMGPPDKNGWREQVTVYLCAGKEYPTREAAEAASRSAK